MKGAISVKKLLPLLYLLLIPLVHLSNRDSSSSDSDVLPIDGALSPTLPLEVWANRLSLTRISQKKEEVDLDLVAGARKASGKKGRYDGKQIVISLGVIVLFLP